jgi:TRAP-type C4-dicarboxylate transport system permease small subunit
MRVFLDRLYLLSGALGALFLVAILLVVLAQVGANLLDTLVHAATGAYQGFVIPSYANFAGFFLVGATFLALAHTFREGGHIRVGLVLQVLPAPLKRAADAVILAVALALTGYMAWYSWALVYDSWDFGDASTGLVSVPLFIPQSAMALGATMFCVALADSLIGTLMGREDKATRLTGAADVVEEA